jgi:hypothetical protein
MVVGVVDVAEKETEIKGQGQDDEESENDFFKIHGAEAPMGSDGGVALVYCTAPGGAVH